MATWSKDELRRIARPTTCTSLHSVRTECRMARRHGFGPSRLTMPSLSERITGRSLVGTRLRCGRKRGRITAKGRLREGWSMSVTSNTGSDRFV